MDHGGKGSHRNFVHPNIRKPITISGNLGDDAKHYQVRAVRLLHNSTLNLNYKQISVTHRTRHAVVVSSGSINFARCPANVSAGHFVTFRIFSFSPEQDFVKIHGQSCFTPRNNKALCQIFCTSRMIQFSSLPSIYYLASYVMCPVSCVANDVTCVLLLHTKSE